ncbi:MAG TPA: pilin [Candidatus Saccharimonadales bacterium]
MFKSLLKNLAVAGSMFVLAFAPAAVLPAAVYAQNDIGDCLSQGSDLITGDGTTCNPGGTSEGAEKIQNIVTMIINIFSIIVGIVAVIMIIYGGFKYITSGGDSGNITSAKNTIIYAIIGLVVVALAQFLVKFVLEKVVSA